MNEADVSRKLREALSFLGAKVAWKMSDRFHASRPDVFCIYQGVASFIETKMFPKEPTPLQHKTLTDLLDGGAQVYVASYRKDSKILTLAHWNNKHTVSFTDIREAAKWLLRPRS